MKYFSHKLDIDYLMKRFNDFDEELKTIVEMMRKMENLSELVVVSSSYCSKERKHLIDHKLKFYF